MNYLDRITKRYISIFLKILNIACAFSIPYFYLSRIAEFKFNFSEHTNFSYTILLISFLITSINSMNLKNISFNHKYYIKILFAIFLLIIGYINKVDKMYLYFGAQLLLIFPFFQSMRNNRITNNSIINKLSLSFIISCILYYIYCFIAAYNGYLCFADNGAFCATTINQNTFANYEVMCLIFSLYYMISNESIHVYILCSITFSISISFVVMTACRAAFLATIVSLMLFLLIVYKRYLIKENKKEYIKILIKKLIILLLLLLFVLKLNNNMIMLNEINSIKENLLSDMSDFSNLLKERINSNTSSRRLDIWKAYLKRIKLFGNKSNIINDNSFTAEMNHNGLYQPAHNTYIEITFWFGLILGIYYLLIIINTFLKAIFDVINYDSYSNESFIKQSVIFAFIIISFFDNITLPYLCPITLIYYLIQ